jgi:hypothetical protein
MLREGVMDPESVLCVLSDAGTSTIHWRMKRAENHNEQVISTGYMDVGVIRRD